MEPKTPDEVYKTWLEGLVLRPTYNLDVPVDSARHNLASTFVNAFVNAGFSRDKLVSVEDGNKWMFKNKQHGTNPKPVIITSQRQGIINFKI